MGHAGSLLNNGSPVLAPKVPFEPGKSRGEEYKMIINCNTRYCEWSSKEKLIIVVYRADGLARLEFNSQVTGEPYTPELPVAPGTAGSALI